MLLSTVALLLLGSSVLLTWVMIALLMLCRRRVGRSATVWVIVALMGRLAVGVVGWRGILALSLGIRAMSLTVLVVGLLSIRLALRRITLLSSIALWLRTVALLLLVCAIVAVALILAVTLAVVVVT